MIATESVYEKRSLLKLGVCVQDLKEQVWVQRIWHSVLIVVFYKHYQSVLFSNHVGDLFVDLVRSRRTLLPTEWCVVSGHRDRHTAKTAISSSYEVSF